MNQIIEQLILQGTLTGRTLKETKKGQVSTLDKKSDRKILGFVQNKPVSVEG